MLIPPEQVTPELESWFEQQSPGDKVHVTVSFQDDDKPSQSPARVNKDSAVFQGMIEDVYRVVDEFPDDNIVVICKKYYSVLEELVNECERLFGLPNG